MENTKYRCPLCGGGMNETDKAILCENGHSFDKASEGHVNFAAYRKGYSTDAGDAADTCRARRAFLEAGFYQPLADAISDVIASRDKSLPPLVIDAGCGEGYYDRYIKGKCPDIDLYGLDLAGVGVKLAAKAQKNLPLKNHFAVDGIFDMPFFDGTAGAVVSVFAPVPDAECRRVLKEGGLLIVACPGKRHLFGLKAALYDTPSENEEKIPGYDGFTLRDVRRVTYQMTLPGEHARTLFAMTPYFWRSTKEIREKSEKLDNVESEADFIIKIYQKNN